MENYQQKRLKAFLLPEPVYRQALWAVKDVPRMKKVLQEAIEREGSLPNQDFSTMRTYEGTTQSTSITERRAMQIVNLSMKIDAIESALTKIPEKYRDGIRNKLMDGIPYGDQCHSNTWKKWQQMYIFYVAKNLGLY